MVNASINEKPTKSGSSSPAPLAHQAIHDTVVGILEKEPSGALLSEAAYQAGLARLRRSLETAEAAGRVLAFQVDLWFSAVVAWAPRLVTAG